MNEEFAIQLKTVLDQSSINTVKEQISDLKKVLEQQMNVAVSPAARASGGASTTARRTVPQQQITPDLSEAYEELKLWETELAYVQQMMKIDTSPLSLERWEEKLQNIKARIEEVKTAIAEMEQEQGGQGPQIFSFMSASTVVIKDNLKGIVKQAGRFALALVGIRGIYGSISKATSSWLSQNKEIQEKLNGAWYALGSLLAPAIEWLVNLFVRLVSLVDALAKALGFAGVNMSKYGKAAGGAAKKQKALMNIDEINNIQDQNAGGGGGSNFKLDPVSDEELEKFKLIGTLVSGIAAGFAAWKISSKFMEALGLTKERCIGIGLAVAGATIFVLAFIDAWKNGLNPQNFNLMLLGATVAIIGLGLAFGTVGVIIGAFTAGIALFIIGLKEFIETGEVSETTAKAIALGVALIGTAIGLLLGGPLGAIVGFVMGTVLGMLVPKVLKNIDNIKEKLSKAGSWFKSSVVNPIISGINGLLKGLGNGINKIVDMLNKISFDVPDWVPALGGKHFGINLSHVSWGNIPLLETGTNYVPNDMLAMLHQGEAVVPKKFNQNDMYGQVSEEELNLLSSINEQLIELNRKDTTINLDGTNIAERINNKIQDITYRNGERVFAVAR